MDTGLRTVTRPSGLLVLVPRSAIDSVEHHFLTPAQREATDDKHLKLMAAA